MNTTKKEKESSNKHMTTKPTEETKKKVPKEKPMKKVDQESTKTKAIEVKQVGSDLKKRMFAITTFTEHTVSHLPKFDLEFIEVNGRKNHPEQIQKSASPARF